MSREDFSITLILKFDLLHVMEDETMILWGKTKTAPIYAESVEWARNVVWRCECLWLSDPVEPGARLRGTEGVNEGCLGAPALNYLVWSPGLQVG